MDFCVKGVCIFSLQRYIRATGKPTTHQTHSPGGTAMSTITNRPATEDDLSGYDRDESSVFVRSSLHKKGYVRRKYVVQDDRLMITIKRMPCQVMVEEVTFPAVPGAPECVIGDLHLPAHDPIAARGFTTLWAAHA